jgi:hypothetical protein
MAMFHVDDGQASHTDGRVGMGDESSAVRSSVPDRVRHRPHHRGKSIYRFVQADDASDTAH